MIYIDYAGHDLGNGSFSYNGDAPAMQHSQDVSESQQSWTKYVVRGRAITNYYGVDPWHYYVAESIANALRIHYRSLTSWPKTTLGGEM